MSKPANTQLLGIYVDAWRTDHKGNSLHGKWMRFVKHRARPRDSEYMKILFERKFPDQDFVSFSGDCKELDDIIRDRSTVVVVFPDAIGHGTAKIGKYLLRHKQAYQQLRILNGRGREFAISSKVLRQLSIRKLLENVPIVDCLLFAGLVVTTPILLLVDALRAKKDVYK